jgi:DNA-directed RNA polymerase specialized sigma24 family protein
MPGDPVAGRLPASPARDAGTDYSRLLAALASRARRLGSHDPEGAAQEALKRSLRDGCSKAAIGYYFSPDPPPDLKPPEWPLDQLFAWLHGVLLYVVREERNRASNRREVPMGDIASERPDGPNPLDRADPAQDALGALIQKELQGIVGYCFPKLEREYREVLAMRMDGLKYGEIAIRLRVNENTVATWVSRGIRELARCVRKRTERYQSSGKPRAGNTV